MNLYIRRQIYQYKSMESFSEYYLLFVEPVCFTITYSVLFKYFIDFYPRPGIY